MRSRSFVSAAAWIVSLAGVAGAQSVIGRFTLMNPQGQPVTLSIEADGPDKVKGSLSGNGITYALAGELEEGTATGLLRGAGGAAYFEAVRQGARLKLSFVELDANGRPNLATARELMFDPAGAGAPAATPPPPAAVNAPGSVGSGDSAQDRELSALLLSSAWCSFSFSGSRTYTGGSGGTTSQSRVVFRADGTVQQTSGSELTNSGSAGNVYGSNSGTVNARWRVQQGVLSTSEDGVQWTPVKLSIARNSNGYPIITADGREYMLCR